MVANSQTGLDKNTASALSYVLGPISGVVMLMMDKDPRVRFHAMQSTLLFGGLIILQIVLGITIILAMLNPLISIAAFIAWLVLIYKSWQGEDIEVPIVGQYARQFLKKV